MKLARRCNRWKETTMVCGVAVRAVFDDENLLSHMCLEGGWQVVVVMRGVNVASARAAASFPRPTLSKLAVPSYDFGHLCMKSEHGLPRRQYIDFSEDGHVKRLVYMPLPYCVHEYARLSHKFFLSSQPDSIMKKILVLSQRQLASIRVEGETIGGVRLNTPLDAVRRCIKHTRGGVWGLLARRAGVLKRKRARVCLTFGEDHDKALARLLELLQTDPALHGFPKPVRDDVLRAAAVAAP